MESEAKAQLKNNIEETKEQISGTVQQIQDRFQGAGIRRQVEQHPWRTVAIAAGAGFLLSGSGRFIINALARNLGTALTTAAGAYIVGAISGKQAADKTVEEHAQHGTVHTKASPYSQTVTH